MGGVGDGGGGGGGGGGVVLQPKCHQTETKQWIAGSLWADFARAVKAVRLVSRRHQFDSPLQLFLPFKNCGLWTRSCDSVCSSHS